MISRGQQRLIRDLATKKKVRAERGLMLIEGEKFVRDNRELIEFSFTDRDVPNYRELVSTETPQGVAAVARIPEWTWEDIAKCSTVVVLDGVQDPGNVGSVLRACLGFDAGLVLLESADPTNPKTVRSSVGAVLATPWKEAKRDEVIDFIASLNRPVYRLEHARDAITPASMFKNGKQVLIAGSEGKGIRLDVPGQSVAIRHARDLESLNVAVATTIVLYELHRT